MTLLKLRKKLKKHSQLRRHPVVYVGQLSVLCFAFMALLLTGQEVDQLTCFFQQFPLSRIYMIRSG